MSLLRAVFRRARLTECSLSPPPPSRIMQIHSRKMNVSPDVNFDELARSTDDFNGAQCKAVCVEAVSRLWEAPGLPTGRDSGTVDRRASVTAANDSPH